MNGPKTLLGLFPANRATCWLGLLSTLAGCLRETSTGVNFIDKHAGFDARVLVHEGFDCFDRSVEDADACYITASAYRANNREQPTSPQGMIAASVFPDDFFGAILAASFPKLQNQQAILPAASAHPHHIFIGNGGCRLIFQRVWSSIWLFSCAMLRAVCLGNGVEPSPSENCA
jgi:hypothetical protein